jgi:hypothetical protein
VDHGRLLQGGEAFWDEGIEPGYRDGRLNTRIRTYKVARCTDNMAFAYTTTPLEMAESMAFNLDCLGCICWFEYGDIVAKPGSPDRVHPSLDPFIRFFRTRHNLLGNAKVIADVAVLRSFPSQVFADAKHARLTHDVEQALIDNRICFQIIYNQHLDDLRRYRALVLAGCVALSDQHIRQIKQYVSSGGCVCVVGPAATYDEWMRTRTKPAFADVPDSQAVRIAEDGDIVAAVRRACDDGLTLSVQADSGLAAELTEQTGRRLVHLVNYRTNDSMRNIVVSVRLPARRRAATVMLASPEREEDISLPFQAQEGCVKFTVPQVNVYEIAVITMK